MRLVTWNVWKTFGEHQRIPEASTWLADRAPDVLALQELCGVDERALAELATRWGHPHVALANETGAFPLGLTARAPIEVLERRTAGLHHGALHARVNGLDLVVVHLHPASWEVRLAEARTLAPLVAASLRAGRPVAVIGDFNAHSPHDRERIRHRAPLLERRRARRPDDLRQMDNAWSFDLEVVETFLALGLRDLEAERLAEPELAGTRPTRLREHARTPELQAGFLERIDLVLVDPATAARCTGVTVARDAVLETISDHYPVVVELAAPS